MHHTVRFGALMFVALVGCGGGREFEQDAGGDDSAIADGANDSSVSDTTTGGDATPDDTATGGDTDKSDGASDGDPGDGGPVDCTGKADGFDCGGGSICIKGACVGSSCGDGYVDGKTGEECDDANTVSGDGCSACKFDCKSAADCDNGESCDGSETCDTTAHKCAAGTAPSDGTPCKLSDGSSGTCKAKACTKAGCGNGIKETGEDCDDGNTVDTDGCTKLCKFTCTADTDCDDGNKCNGTETCDLVTHRCKAGVSVVCAPKVGCTGTCEPSTGACSYPDADKDGVSCDKDCNDADPAVFPGAFECKDGKDNDCNAATLDPTAPSCLCYQDVDKDGYAPSGASTVTAVTCPSGYTRRAPVDAATTDCGPYTASAFPGQTAYFTSSYCKVNTFLCPLSARSFDYDCDGVAEQRYTRVTTSGCKGATSLFACLLRSGWVGVSAAPACGASATYRSCTWTGSACIGSDATRTQECH